MAWAAAVLRVAPVRSCDGEDTDVLSVRSELQAPNPRRNWDVGKRLTDYPTLFLSDFSNAV